MPPSTPRPPLTHFLCIPLVTSTSRPQLQAALQKFKADVTSTSTSTSLSPLNPSSSTLPPSSSTLDPEEEEEDNGWSTISRSRRENKNEKGEEKFSIPESAIRPLGTLHLTLGVMSLTTSELVRGAVELLHNLDLPSLLSPPAAESSASEREEPRPGMKEPQPDATENQTGRKESHPLKISLRGLHPMHTPSTTSILYAAPVSSPPDTLLTLCERLRDRFTEAGFMVKEERALKLHATVVNTVYVKGGRGVGNAGNSRGGGKGDWGRGHGKRKAKITFDAREVMERYKDFEWMREVRVEKVAICRMGAKRGEDGEERYEVEAEVDVEGV
ncbi:activating signal cointegrator 1 complex subunit 1 protein [Rutstroemia sp. NJR-2017a WRK4]|nr:activating signal cointegrator 1 complex subunit 1 protein [Rutstroemia sp. NJR-2017a WRK4]